MNNALPPCAPNLVDDAVTRKSLPSLILRAALPYCRIPGVVEHSEYLDLIGHNAIEDAVGKTPNGGAANIPQNLPMQFGVR